MYTFILRMVMRDAQAPIASKGRIILGKMLPCIWRKMGHLECFWISRGPVCRAVSAPGFIQPFRRHSQGTDRSGGTHKVIINIQRCVLATEGIWGEEPGRGERSNVLYHGAVGADALWSCLAVKTALAVAGSPSSFSYRSSRGAGSRAIVGHGGWFWSSSWMATMGERSVVSERV